MNDFQEALQVDGSKCSVLASTQGHKLNPLRGNLKLTEGMLACWGAKDPLSPLVQAKNPGLLSGYRAYFVVDIRNAQEDERRRTSQGITKAMGETAEFGKKAAFTCPPRA